MESAVAGQAMIDDGKLELLQEMYATWPFFSVTLDMVEMVLTPPNPPPVTLTLTLPQP